MNNNNITYSTIRTRYDKNPSEREVSWEKLIKLVTAPCTWLAKDDIPLWRFISLNGKEGRNDDCYDKTTAVTVEFDDGLVTISDFIAKYRSRQFVLYTTPSHNADCPRFRAIFPLNHPVPFKDTKLIRAKLNRLFQGCDESSMSNWQRVPGVTPTTTEYQYYINDVTERLDLDASIKASKMTAAADAGLLAARKGQQEAQSRRMGTDGSWTRERATRYCEDKLYPKLKEKLDQIPLREGRHQALMNFITYMSALTWPGTQIYIYSSRDAENWLRPWFCINDRKIELKINTMIHRFFGNRR